MIQLYGPVEQSSSMSDNYEIASMPARPVSWIAQAHSRPLSPDTESVVDLAQSSGSSIAPRPKNLAPLEVQTWPDNSQYCLHKLYYMPVIKLRVQDVLFQLPMHLFLDHSEVFAQLYDLPLDASEMDGGRIIELVDVDCTDFENFLKALAPRSPLLEEKPDLVQDEWISVLKLSTLWFFNDLRQVAIQALTILDIGPIRRINLARQYHIHEWLLSGYEELVARMSPIREDDVEEIGFRVALKLSGMIVERFRTGGSPGDTDVREGFHAELEEIRVHQRRYLTKKERLERERWKAEEEARLVLLAEEAERKAAIEEERYRVLEKDRKRKQEEERDALLRARDEIERKLLDLEVQEGGAMGPCTPQQSCEPAEHQQYQTAIPASKDNDAAMNLPYPSGPPLSTDTPPLVITYDPLDGPSDETVVPSETEAAVISQADCLKCRKRRKKSARCSRCRLA
ncbi:hypothetical protein CC1G_07115 [Coprinopsis cinerea okayama7|uniref:BTB domain-containing protein n=1 Tax=Coprinopsis cinerea (strain Okayama-7 / 130 / ATCC MYA-4618 / FGSC 9003) TaxID=240176 RepID=A8NUI8_COPC7|nr:hypothetical protein CC1G_07115 [Coprinopsis cinerea okayama7\|eukprot:XP_001836468.2 hypothetical protein CC1G_07115 [Coprinopsis cinerea okayama7\